MGEERLEIVRVEVVVLQPFLHELSAKRAALEHALAVHVREGDQDVLRSRVSGASGASMFWVMPRAEPPQVAILPLHHFCPAIHWSVSRPSRRSPQPSL